MPDLDAEPTLVNAITADPGDRAPWLAYADWLEENGRGEEAGCIARHRLPLRFLVRQGHRPSAVLRSVFEGAEELT